MYLKRLELQGFKSFRDRTPFEFGSGVTAVVGPNGSGKSNVGESIRWVLGDASSRSVRARRLEDVIFSGSSTKSAVGLAEVAITLDNSDGWLPVDYSEVVVARRAYRSGESEYLINRNKVRLRDVLDLFMRAQVGQNSYAFMGQGLVEEVLLMRPEERRRLLEEAADVRLLRTRLDEARDRLSATRENLERVNLLIEEIAPRLRQLERQASRAVEHSRLAKELAQTLRELYTRLWADAQASLTSAHAVFDQQQQELTVVRAEAKACEEGLTALNAAIEERERELGQRRRQQRELNDRAHSLEQRLVFDKERIEGQTRRRVELEAELQSLRDERADLQRSIATAQERARAVRPEIEEAKALIASRRAEMADIEQEHGSVRRRVADSEDKIERAKRAVADFDAQLKKLAEDEQRSTGDVGRRTERRKALLEDLAALGRDFLERSEELYRIERDIEIGERERVNLTAVVETARNTVYSFESEAVELNGRAQQLLSRQEMLLRLQASGEGVDAGARFLLGEEPDAEGRTRAAEGLMGLVRDALRVPPGLERAVEAALAENVHALVFQNTKTALAAIDQLEQHQTGRATIYPLDGIRAVPPLNLNRERGIIGVAARLVRCENAFRPLVDALLGRTIVVEHLDVGTDVLKRGLGAVVTLDGVLLRQNGSIAGGAMKSASETFTRQRELDELPQEIEHAQQQLDLVSSRLRRERGALETTAGQLARLGPELEALRKQRTELQSALHQNRGRLILLASEAKNLWGELRRGDDGHDWAGRRARIQKERERSLAEGVTANETLARDREALSALASRRNAAVDIVSEAVAAHADLEGEARSLNRQVDLLRENIARVETRLRSREDALKALTNELTTLQQRDAGGDEELSQLRSELEALRVEISPAQGELDHLISRQRTMREQLAAATTKLLATERAFLEVESAVKLRGDEMEALRGTIEAEGYRIEGRNVVQAAAEPVASAPEEPRLPPIMGGAEVDVESLRAHSLRLRQQIRSLGPVNEQAQTDYGESKERYDFLTSQVADLTGSEETLQEAIGELETNIRERLTTTFADVDSGFQRYFEAFFKGGKAHLGLTQPDDMANTGIEIIAQPPGKKVNNIAMLSGGERALTSLALLMSLLEAHPSPICVLDEVDAALDETNVGRFVEAVKVLEKKTQFIIITHNPRTMEAADMIYGVSMGADNTSRVLSVKLDQKN